MRLRVLSAAATFLVLIAASDLANADDTCSAGRTSQLVQATWGATGSSGSTVDTSPVARARELLSRAKFLDDAATSDEKSSVEISAKLGALRSSAKSAREKAERATGDDKESLTSRAESLEADVTVSEAEVEARRRTAAENRRVARDLRTRAVKLVREAPIAEEHGSSCDPPFRYTADGRKIYRIECLK